MAASASIDAAAALKMPGVHAVITAKDMPGGPPIIPMRLQPLPEFKPFEQPVIAPDKVRYVGEPVAVVLADSAALGEDALEAIARRHRAAAAGDRPRHAPTLAEGVLFEPNGQQLRARPSARCAATPTRRSGRALYAAASASRPQRHYGLTMEPRGVLAEWDAAAGILRVFGRRQGAVLQPPHPGGADRPAGERDRHGRERRRRRVRRARRVLSGGFPDPVRGAPCRPAGQVDRGPPREPDGDEPRARGRGRHRDRLRPRRHHPRPARPRLTSTWAPTCAPTARSARATSRSSCRARTASPNIEHRRHAVDDQQDAGRHLSRAGPVRDRFLPRAAVRHRRAGSRHRPRRVPPPQSDRRSARCPIALATITPFESKDQFDSGDYQLTLDRCLQEIGWAEKAKLQGKLIDGRYHGLAHRLLHRRRRRRAEGERAARAQRRTARSRSSSARRRSGRGSRPSSRRSRPTRSKCRSTASASVHHGSTALS